MPRAQPQPWTFDTHQASAAAHLLSDVGRKPSKHCTGLLAALSLVLAFARRDLERLLEPKSAADELQALSSGNVLDGQDEQQLVWPCREQSRRSGGVVGEEIDRGQD